MIMFEELSIEEANEFHYLLTQEVFRIFAK